MDKDESRKEVERLERLLEIEKYISRVYYLIIIDKMLHDGVLFSNRRNKFFHPIDINLIGDYSILLKR
jgi:hypothetical protein